jgi:hypothetical protein
MAEEDARELVKRLSRTVSGHHGWLLESRALAWWLTKVGRRVAFDVDRVECEGHYETHAIVSPESLGWAGLEHEFTRKLEVEHKENVQRKLDEVRSEASESGAEVRAMPTFGAITLGGTFGVSFGAADDMISRLGSVRDGTVTEGREDSSKITITWCDGVDVRPELYKVIFVCEDFGMRMDTGIVRTSPLRKGEAGTKVAFLRMAGVLIPPGLGSGMVRSFATLDGDVESGLVVATAYLEETIVVDIEPTHAAESIAVSFKCSKWRAMAATIQTSSGEAQEASGTRGFKGTWCFDVAGLGAGGTEVKTKAETVSGELNSITTSGVTTSTAVMTTVDRRIGQGEGLVVFREQWRVPALGFVEVHGTEGLRPAVYKLGEPKPTPKATLELPVRFAPGAVAAPDRDDIAKYGMRLLEGNEVPRDRKAAMRYLNEAARLGHGDARDMVEKLRPVLDELSPEEANARSLGELMTEAEARAAAGTAGKPKRGAPAGSKKAKGGAPVGSKKPKGGAPVGSKKAKVDAPVEPKKRMPDPTDDVRRQAKADPHLGVKPALPHSKDPKKPKDNSSVCCVLV